MLVDGVKRTVASVAFWRGGGSVIRARNYKRWIRFRGIAALLRAARSRPHSSGGLCHSSFRVDLLLADPPEVSFGANEKRSVRWNWRGEHRFAECVRREQLAGFAGFDDVSNAAFVEEINSTF